MRASVKNILLVITLVLPVLTYLFLKSFGDNRYQLPVYYGAGQAVANCEDLPFPHLLNWQLFSIQAANANIFYFPKEVSDPDFYRQLERVTSKFEGVEVFAVMKDNITAKIGKGIVIDDDTDFLNIINCQLMLGEGINVITPPTHKLVLVDRDGQIRGYYLGSDFEDMDRLDMELKILFTEYGYQ